MHNCGRGQKFVHCFPFPFLVEGSWKLLSPGLFRQDGERKGWKKVMKEVGRVQWGRAGLWGRGSSRAVTPNSPLWLQPPHVHMQWQGCCGTLIILKKKSETIINQVQVHIVILTKGLCLHFSVLWLHRWSFAQSNQAETKSAVRYVWHNAFCTDSTDIFVDLHR